MKLRVRGVDPEHTREIRTTRLARCSACIAYIPDTPAHRRATPQRRYTRLHKFDTGLDGSRVEAHKCGTRLRMNGGDSRE